MVITVPARMPAHNFSQHWHAPLADWWMRQPISEHPSTYQHFKWVTADRSVLSLLSGWAQFTMARTQKTKNNVQILEHQDAENKALIYVLNKFEIFCWYAEFPVVLGTFFSVHLSKHLTFQRCAFWNYDLNLTQLPPNSLIIVKLKRSPSLCLFEILAIV